MGKEVKIIIPDDCEIIQTGEGKWEQRKIERELPKTWDEFCKTHPIKEDEYYLSCNGDGISAFGKHPDLSRDPRHRDILPNKETAEAFVALMQLIQLRNCYNGDWVPDWNDESRLKSVIVNNGGKDLRTHSITTNYVLTFKSEELRDQFLENFGDLIEIAKPLI